MDNASYIDLTKCDHYKCDDYHATECRVFYYCSRCYYIVNKFIEKYKPTTFLSSHKEFKHLAIMKPRLNLDHRPLQRRKSNLVMRDELTKIYAMNINELLDYAKKENTFEGSWNIRCDKDTLNDYWEHFAVDFSYSASNLNYVEIKCRLLIKDGEIDGGIISIVNNDFRDVNAVKDIVSKITQVTRCHHFEQQHIYYVPKLFSDLGVSENYHIYSAFLNQHTMNLLFSVGVKKWLDENMVDSDLNADSC